MKLKNMLGRVIVKLVSGAGYSFTCLDGENITNVEHLQEFGFASKKPDGEDANGIALFYAGDKGNSSLLVMEVPKFKPNLENGEAALFNAFGSIVKLLKDGGIEITASPTGDIILSGLNITLDPTTALKIGAVPGITGIATPANTITFVNGIATVIT